MLETIGLPIVKGRPFTRLDVEWSLRVAIVDEAFVRTYLGTHEPLGQAVRLEMLANLPVPLPEPTFQIIGVVRDAVNASAGSRRPR